LYLVDIFIFDVVVYIPMSQGYESRTAPNVVASYVHRITDRADVIPPGLADIGYGELAGSTSEPPELTHDVSDSYLSRTLPTTAAVTLFDMYMIQLDSLVEGGVPRSKAKQEAEVFAIGTMMGALGGVEQPSLVRSIIAAEVDDLRAHLG
jgi:hypothetical protein